MRRRMMGRSENRSNFARGTYVNGRNVEAVAPMRGGYRF